MKTEEWIELNCGSVLHATSVYNRTQYNGWTKASARSTPLRPHKGYNGRPNTAARARADRITPSKVQLLMREYGVPYEQARDYLQAK